MPNVYLKAVMLGTIAGMRSMSAPSFVSSHLTQTQSDDLVGSPLEWMTLPMTSGVFQVLALGELVVDKLPKVPARTEPIPLVVRGLTGALSGASLTVAEGEGIIEGAAIGALAAIASSHLFYRLRRWLTQSTPLPDPVLALAEDGLVFGLAHAALRQQE